jgi:hypothetical protein
MRTTRLQILDMPALVRSASSTITKGYGAV